MAKKQKDKGKSKDEEAPESAAVEGEEGAEGEGGKKKLPLKMIIIGAVAAVLVLGGGGTAAFIFLAPKAPAAGDPAHPPKTPPKPKGGGEHGGGENKGPPDPNAPVVREGPDGVVFYTLPDLVVNLDSPEGGRPTFLKLKLTFELPDEETAEALTPAMPRLKDMFQNFLRELRPEDLSGSAGNFQLRMELQRRVNLVAAPHRVNAVLIEEQLIN